MIRKGDELVLFGIPTGGTEHLTLFCAQGDPLAVLEPAWKELSTLVLKGGEQQHPWAETHQDL